MLEASRVDRACGEILTGHVQPLLVTACQEAKLLGPLKQILYTYKVFGLGQQGGSVGKGSCFIHVVT